MAIDTILPRRCASCGDIVNVLSSQGKQGGFCANCWSNLKFITPPWCISCSRPFPYEAGEELGEDARKCSECLNKDPIHDGIRAALHYDDIPRDVILKLKYSGRIGIANLVAGHLLRYLQDDAAIASHTIWFVPVPLHWTRLWKRSYNQSALIADALLKAAAYDNICHNPDVLKRVKKTPPLQGNAEARRKLLKNAFVVNDKYKDAINGKCIILIDDVYTSGATSDACVKALKAAGAQRVIIYCWTRVLKY